MRFEDYDSVPRRTVPPVSNGRDSTECGLSNFSVWVYFTNEAISEMKLRELRDALRPCKCSHTFPCNIPSLCLATRRKLLYLLLVM